MQHLYFVSAKDKFDDKLDSNKLSTDNGITGLPLWRSVEKAIQSHTLSILEQAEGQLGDFNNLLLISSGVFYVYRVTVTIDMVKSGRLLTPHAVADKCNYPQAVADQEYRLFGKLALQEKFVIKLAGLNKTTDWYELFYSSYSIAEFDYAVEQGLIFSGVTKADGLFKQGVFNTHSVRHVRHFLGDRTLSYYVIHVYPNGNEVLIIRTDDKVIGRQNLIVGYPQSNGVSPTPDSIHIPSDDITLLLSNFTTCELPSSLLSNAKH